MKKLFVVSKTHLDLGFTDYAENIKDLYINSFIPSAVSLANEVNKDGKKRFIWTTGSWIIKEALNNGTPEQRKNLEDAIKRGDIVPHALPFTTHTELLDRDTLDYGLTIVDELDKLRGRKTTAAKMTDVPGHTKGLVKSLCEHSIKLLHIGVNGASAVPEVPECFVWKDGKYEVVVVYSGDYGGAYKSDIIDEILYFDHTLDNCGAPNPQKIFKKLESIEKEYPDYEVSAGCLDDFADIIWEQREKLPVIENEIGDTWIHGSAADPYKSASLRELMRLKAKWLKDKTMTKGSCEYNNFSDGLICIAEHTCGMDMKKFFADYEHYLKKDFEKARQKDIVKMRHPLRDFPQNFLIMNNRKNGGYKQGSYKVIEKSWAEQRKYIDLAVNSLSDEHKAEALNVLKWLRPEKPLTFADKNKTDRRKFKSGKWELKINKNGGIGELLFDGDNVIKNNDRPIIEYRSFSKSDYDFWIENYTRNYKSTFGWSVGDFARPLLKYVKNKYPQGRFPYSLDSVNILEETEKKISVCADFSCDKKLPEELGAPHKIQIVYALNEDGLTFDVSWFKKDANRLTEAMYLHIMPAFNELSITKIDEDIDPFSVASKGGRKLHAVFNAHIKTDGGEYRIINRHSPVLSLGTGKILEFDNKFEDCQKDGITYVLHDNVWGTNFPLWYEENARFRFEITDEKTFSEGKF